MANTDAIEWNDSMQCGVDEIDRQHRILVDLLAEASAKLTGRANDPIFDRITQDLLAYAIYHFDTEEKLMQQYGFVNAEPDEGRGHIAAHRHFAEEVVAMRDEARTWSPDADAALIRFLRDWLVDHILTTDKRFGRFILAARSASGAASK